MVTAHSGCDGTPDNSMAYIRHAMTCGADALEIDVHACPGGFYLSHDESSEDCPDLEEVFKLLSGRPIRINCDLKEFGLEEEVLALAERCGAAGQVLFSGSVSGEVLLRDPDIRRRTLWNIECALPELLESYDQGIMPGAEDVRRAAETCRHHGAAVINVHYRLCTEENLEIFRAHGVAVSAWTVNEEPDARRLLEAGVGNITTRRPGMVCSLRERLPGA